MVGAVRGRLPEAQGRVRQRFEERLRELGAQVDQERVEQEILLMDFRSNMTQLQIGRQLGISQMHVSRLRTRALGYLRSCLLDLGERAS